MAQWVFLFNLTDKAAKEVADLEGVVEARKKEWSDMAGSDLMVCLTMGKYDLVAIGEADDDTAAAFALLQARQGYFRTTSMRAFDIAELPKFFDKQEQHDPS